MPLHMRPGFRFSYFGLTAFLLEWNAGQACPASKPKSWGYPVQELCVLACEDQLLGVCTYENSHWLKWIRSLVPWIMSRLAVNAALEDWVNYRIPVNVKLYFSAETATAKSVMYTLCSVPWPPKTGGWMEEGLRGAQVNSISRDLPRQRNTTGEVIEALDAGKTSWILWLLLFFLLQSKKNYVKSSLSL